MSLACVTGALRRVKFPQDGLCKYIIFYTINVTQNKTHVSDVPLTSTPALASKPSAGPEDVADVGRMEERRVECTRT
ncbi:hypothetical protein HPB47_009174 [Ixodes persulcatus]|uniref:Uncharacterized protein n=1 Tax=Ixodes persulcatus TaxID=34615 RepID=A0AC60P2M6_IXOPE|nr:hypothetical protein HPB47_009174 [Ixodes persulcatus]